MAEITAKDVQALRMQTGVSMMECKRALVEANGNADEAIKILREKGLAVAAKKASRIAADGVVDIMYDDNTKTAIMIEVNSETDFVAKNEDFQSFVKSCLNVIAKERPADVAELLAKPFEDKGMTVEDMLKEKILVIGENLTVRIFVIVEGIMSTYIHGNGKIGVIVKLDAEEKAVNDEGFGEFKKNLALQVSAIPPLYIAREDVPASVIEEEREIISNQIKNDEANAKKPENVIQKMVDGKVNKYYENNCLLEQEYIRDDKITIKQYIEAYKKQTGAEISVVAYYRFEKGEGIQKREENFAEEIAKLTQQ